MFISGKESQFFTFQKFILKNESRSHDNQTCVLNKICYMISVSTLIRMNKRSIALNSPALEIKVDYEIKRLKIRYFKLDDDPTNYKD